MKILAHISDLHLGTEDKKVAESLVEELSGLKPSLLVISGDLTQRARKKQFLEAKQYINRLPKPQLIIPGNHDIPLFDIFRRIFMPLKRYKKYLTKELAPFFLEDGLAVIGLNTARAYKWKNGEISAEQIELLKDRLCNISDECFKVVVTHHPFIPPPDGGLEDLVNRAQLAVDVIDPCGIDLLLAGHLHHGYTGDIRKHYPSSRRSVIVAQAGTAISKRTRKEANSYNIIYVNGDTFEISVKVFRENEFVEQHRTRYKYTEGQWTQMS